MKVLIADGSSMVADRLLTVMRDIPNVELLAPTLDAQATMGSIRSNNPEVLIVDARIPGARGMEFLQSIRRENPALVLIILSNLVYPQYRKQYEAAGADLFIDKSNEFIHLFQFVRELVRGSDMPVDTGSKDGIRAWLASSKLKVGLQLALLAFGTSSHFMGL